MPPSPMRLAGFVLLALLAGCGDRTPPDVSGAAPSAAGTFGEAAPVDAVPPGADLRAALDAEFSPDLTLGYARARDAMYAYEAATHGGGLCDVYAGRCAPLPPGDPSLAAGQIGVNAEHTWPQSYGARDEPLKSDLHHLFPSVDRVNASRGNLPLADVPDARAEAWYRGDASQSRIPPVPGAWSQRGAGRFEPRDAHKGDAARALFYVAAVYPEVLAQPGGAAFFEVMRPDLLVWNRADPPDDAERARDTWIAGLQGSHNPFVLDPTLADRAFGAPVSGTAVRTSDRRATTMPDRPPAPSGAAGAPADAPPVRDGAALWLSEIHYDNVGDDTGEGVEIAGPPGARLDGWAVALYNGTDGRVYRTVPLGGLLAGGARWVPVAGLQNGPSDGVALVAPDGTPAEFWAYEGALTASDGPASGRRARVMEASEAARTPAGQALVRPGPSAPWRLGPASPGRR